MRVGCEHPNPLSPLLLRQAWGALSTGFLPQRAFRCDPGDPDQSMLERMEMKRPRQTHCNDLLGLQWQYTSLGSLNNRHFFFSWFWRQKSKTMRASMVSTFLLARRGMPSHRILTWWETAPHPHVVGRPHTSSLVCFCSYKDINYIGSRPHLSLITS